MLKLKLTLISLVLLFNGCASAPKIETRWQGGFMELEPFKKGERILILAPHPDDETIACAGIIQKALAAGAAVKIVFLTNGDHNEFAFIVYEKRITLRQGEFIHLGKVRQQESTKAMEFLGLAKENLVFLGYPDYGTFEIFSKYWQTEKPFRDRLTRISRVPYPDSPAYGANYSGENMLGALTEQILKYQPDKIFVAHPADVNVDHKTLYLLLQVALSDLEQQIKKPKIYAYLVHYVGWPKPRHYHPELELNPADKFTGSALTWQKNSLSPQELDKKHRSIFFYRSQTQSSAFYLLSFARKNELFSDYPELELMPSAQLATPEKPEVLNQNQGSVSYSAADHYLIVRLDRPGKFSGSFGAMFYFFGYSKSTPFARMPKVRIITRGNKCIVFSAKERVINSGVQLEAKKSYLVLKIPFALLGHPDYLLTSAKAYHGNLTVDAQAFRKVNI